MAVLRNAHWERFLHNVIKGMKHGPAYTAAGYKATGNAAETAAARLFRNVQVKERYAELMAPAVEAAEATVERVVKEMTRLAFYDMTVVLDVADGRRRRGRDL